MPRSTLRRLAVHHLIDALPAALLPVATGMALAAALGADPSGAAFGLLTALAVTLLLILPALAVGTAVGTLAGAWAGLLPRSFAGWFGRLLGALGPLLPGFLLAALAATAVHDGASAAPLGWTALALPAACQAARLSRPAMDRALDGGVVRMVQGFGLDDRAVLRHHALPAAAVPVMGGFRNAVLAAVTGAVALESLLGLPGAGALLIDAARGGSAAALPPLVALCGLAAFLTALGAVARDWLDPLAWTPLARPPLSRTAR